MTASLAPAPVEAAPPSGVVSDVQVAATLVGLLVVLGAVLGPVWAWWSPSRMASVLYPGGGLLPDTDSYNGHREESWIAGDGRFMIISAIVGLLAAIGVWVLRRRNRGPVIAAALAVGGVGGALLMDLTGYLTGGGDGDGRYRVELTDGTIHPYTKELPLWVHASGALVLEAAVAVLVYLVLAAFTSRDDLGRPDPVRERLHAVRVRAAMSVQPGPDPQHGWGYRDAPGAAQQGEFSPGERGDVP